MSLFGDEDEPKPKQSQSQSLFGDEPSPQKASNNNSSSLFKDDPPGRMGDATWDYNSPKKKTTPRALFQAVPPDDEISAHFNKAFDAVLASKVDDSDYIDSGLIQVLLRKLDDINTTKQERVLDSMRSNRLLNDNRFYSRGDLFMVLGFIALAEKEGRDFYLDEAQEITANTSSEALFRSLRDAFEAAWSNKQPASKPSNTNHTADDSLQNHSSEPLNDPMSDPWASPASTVRKPKSSLPNGQHHNPARTTSTFTTATTEPSEAPSKNPPEEPSGGGAEPWSSYTGGGNEGFGSGGYGEGSDRFGGSGGGGGGGGDDDQPLRKTATAPRRQGSHGAEEVLTVISLPEKEGTFLFQYRNYEISSSRRSATVIRRYSDFVWLLDCLHKRYPFRALPLLPPKRVSINGNHIAADGQFIEKRRRGLSRFVNALIQHPVLRDEQLVQMFLTVPTELASWRKSTTIPLTPDIDTQPYTPSLEDSLPPTLPDTLTTVRAAIRSSATTYITLCATLERLLKRRDGLSTEYQRLASSFSSLTDTTPDAYALDPADAPLLNDALSATARHLARHAALLDRETRTSWDDAALEHLKALRDAAVALRDLFDRRDRALARNAIPALERRIAASEGKLAAVRARPEAARKPGEAERLEESVTRDKGEIVAQHERGVKIACCVREEVRGFLARDAGAVAGTLRALGEERVVWAREAVGNWAGLEGEMEGLEGVAGA